MEIIAGGSFYIKICDTTMPSRICPNCKEKIRIGTVKFDNNNNVICPKCNEPMIAATTESETKIKSTTTIKSNVGTHHTSHTAGSHAHHGCYP